MNLGTAFCESARAHAGKAALFWGDDEYTYERLLELSLQVADTLRSRHGVQPGDRVGIWLRNCPEFIPALFGVLLADAVAVPINNFLRPAEVAYIVEDAEIDVLISENSMAAGISELVASRPSLQPCMIETLHGSSPAEPSFPALPGPKTSDLALIIYTSGTTGRPKGAMLSHGNLLHNVGSCRQVLEAVAADRFALLLPMFHSFMLCVCIFLPLLVGGSIVLIKSLHPARNILQEILRREATILPAIPQFFRTLANAPLPSGLPLRICISGAAPLPVEILNEFHAKVAVPLIEGYGLSEASPVVSLNPIKGPWKAGSIGRPIADVAMSVQDESGHLLPDGEVGEICVQGGNVMQGYWKQPTETARIMRHNWLLTGDVGYRDADGYYYITDRKKDMLLVNGINVYPREIEEVIYRFPGVKETAVIGKPDPRKGEQPVAFVVPDDGTTIDEKSLIQHVRERLADYKVPRRVVMLASLPRNATGKVLKTALRELQV